MVGRGAMGYFAKPPETVAGFVPEVCLREEGRGSEALKPERAWGEAVPGSEKYFAPGPRLVRGEQRRCASVGIICWAGGVVKECHTNSGGCEAGGVIGIVLVAMGVEKSGGCDDGAVVRVVGVWELNIPVRLWFVADHGEHEGYGVVDALDTAVGARVVGAGGNLIDAEAVVEGEGRFGAKPSPFVGE